MESVRRAALHDHKASNVAVPADDLADGTHAIDQRNVWLGARGTGSLSFSRSRDVPFADIAHPDARTYQSTIDVELRYELLDTGCVLATSTPVHLVQSGPVKKCGGSSSGLGGSH